jgi:hypothetical protein
MKYKLNSIVSFQVMQLFMKEVNESSQPQRTHWNISIFISRLNECSGFEYWQNSSVTYCLFRIRSSAPATFYSDTGTDGVRKWYSANFMKPNFSKIRIVSITRKTNILDYQQRLGNSFTLLTEYTYIRNYGVHIACKLRFRHNVDFLSFFLSSSSSSLSSPPPSPLNMNKNYKG